MGAVVKSGVLVPPPALSVRRGKAPAESVVQTHALVMGILDTVEAPTFPNTLSADLG